MGVCRHFIFLFWNQLLVTIWTTAAFFWRLSSNLFYSITTFSWYRHKNELINCEYCITSWWITRATEVEMDGGKKCCKREERSVMAPALSEDTQWLPWQLHLALLILQFSSQERQGGVGWKKADKERAGKKEASILDIDRHSEGMSHLAETFTGVQGFNLFMSLTQAQTYSHKIDAYLFFILFRPLFGLKDESLLFYAPYSLSVDLEGLSAQTTCYLEIQSVTSVEAEVYLSATEEKTWWIIALRSPSEDGNTQS